MNNLFAMVTLKNSHNYTNYALDSFFKNTELSENDEFLLFDNDGCELDSFSINKKIKIISNRSPLSFSKNVNLAIKKAIEGKKNLVFLNNDIIFTKDWLKPLEINSKSISIPTNNQLFSYQSECGKLKLKPTMVLKDFDNNHILLNSITKVHKKRFKNHKQFQALLMPFFCFKVPHKILEDVGYFDEAFVCGAEDVDYRIRCAQKGYDVNFLTDSYLLHFHGKSTWDGNETSNETEERNKLYTKAFLKKWGEDMTQIFIVRQNLPSILNKKGLTNIFKEGRFKELIKELIQVS